MPNLVCIKRGEEAAFADQGLIGGKARHQALAAADGLPVLPGLVLTTEAFPDRAWLDEQANKTSAAQAEAVREYLKKLGVDLPGALASLPDRSLAFRSSATGEDLAVGSFAGSFVSPLKVKPEDAFSAVYAVWSSTFSDRLRGYLRDGGLDDHWTSIKMAVLIQPMVAPFLSGVALSHPLGRPSSPFISVGVVRGLGEQLVAGEVTPQTFLLERGSYAIVEQKDAIDTGAVYEVAAEIGRAVEFLELKRGVPQDIEFAIDANYAFTLLQNRPIVLANTFSQV